MNRASLYITAHRILVEAIMAQDDFRVRCVQDRKNQCQLNVRKGEDLLIAIQVYTDEFANGYLQYQHEMGSTDPLIGDIINRLQKHKKIVEEVEIEPVASSIIPLFVKRPCLVS